MSKNVMIAMALVILPMAGYATEYITVEHPRQECWNEQVPVRSSGYGGAIVGGIAGGILGNQVGGGNGKTVATAIGAATGAVVGDRISGSPSYAYQNVQRCRTVVDRERVPVAEQVYYIEREEHVYRHDHGRHRGWYKHHHHDEDDDDDD